MKVEFITIRKSYDLIIAPEVSMDYFACQMGGVIMNCLSSTIVAILEGLIYSSHRSPKFAFSLVALLKPYFTKCMAQ